MKSIIEGIYNGTLPPCREAKLINPKRDELTSKLLDMEVDIKEQFPECKTAFENYLNTYSDYEEVVLYEQFLNGFKIGVQLMSEVLELDK